MVPTDVIELDVRNLEPPEPLERALKAAGGLLPGQTLRLRIHREPFPLYELLDAMGCSHAIETLRADDHVVSIRRPDRAGGSARA